MVATQQKRAIGVFPDRDSTEAALNQLNDSGFPKEHISLIARDVDKSGEEISGQEVSTEIGDKKVRSTTGMVEDVTAMSATGFVMLGLTSLALPGLGVILAAGSLGAALAAGVASTGAAAISSNNLVKALIEYGVPDTQAGVYSDRLQ
ncbi:hypothetical protein [Oscillatoria sp. FACHB-1407]|uniref:hypothetical protein n=1 Tax=Oscillatoria sp. FACHB-1407 TaxID=2692847 RepID=UPI0018F01273|nr:hypothetical protein [Oscillatoria sp. FACHB-1407]